MKDRVGSNLQVYDVGSVQEHLVHRVEAIAMAIDHVIVQGLNVKVVALHMNRVVGVSVVGVMGLHPLSQIFHNASIIGRGVVDAQQEPTIEESEAPPTTRPVREFLRVAVLPMVLVHSEMAFDPLVRVKYRPVLWGRGV